MKAERIIALLGAGVIAICSFVPAYAGNDDKSERGKQLHALGIEYERSLSLADADRRSALGSVNTRLMKLIDDGLDKHQRFAGALLHAEVLSALGEVGAALKQYDEAAKSGKKTPYVDDILAAKIEAAEAAGDDTGATRLRDEWLRRFTDSPMRHEVMIAHAWNALRADSLPLSTHWFDVVCSDMPRLENDPRVQLAIARLDDLERTRESD